MNNKTNRISSIPRTFGMALLGLALSTGAALAERPGTDAPPESLGASAQSENLRSGGVAPLAFAVETLGAGSFAMDAWAINCPAGTHHVAYDIKDYSVGGPTFGIAAVDFFPTSGFASMTRANQGAISPVATQNGGSGWYTLYVFKTGGAVASAGTYDSIRRCHTASPRGPC